MADTSLLDSVRSKHIREKLFQWDDKLNAKTFLTNVQKDSIIELTTKANFKRLPIEVTAAF